MSGPAVSVGHSAIGRGVFAAQHFQPGQRILSFDGPMLSTPEMLALGPDRAFAPDQSAFDLGPVLEDHHLRDHAFMQEVDLADAVARLAQDLSGAEVNLTQVWTDQVDVGSE